MEAVFLNLLNKSITAGWLILVILVLRVHLKKAPKWLTCILWGTVAFRLICPFSIEASFSLVPDTEPLSPSVISHVKNPSGESSTLISNNVQKPGLDEAPTVSTETNAKPLQIFISAASILWVIGCSCMLGYAVTCYLRIYSKVREAVPLRDNIWICDAVGSPFILGIIRPKIYLSSSINGEQMKYVLSHEQAHLKRKDHWWKLAGYFLLSVYWFHPLIWAAYILFCRDLELACDEKAVKDLDLYGKKAYSEALVACSMPKRMILVCPPAFGEVGVKDRVTAVLDYKKPAFWVVLASIAACITVSICFLSDPKKNAFDLKIVIPAGSEETFYYSEQEISTNGNSITLFWGNGAGGREVTLMSTDDTTAQYVFMAPGTSVILDAEKGTWFKVGVRIGNLTNEDRTIYVRAKNVDAILPDPDYKADLSNETRPGRPDTIAADVGSSDTNIADADSSDTNIADTESSGANIADADVAITAAILDNNASSFTNSNQYFKCCDFLTLETSTDDTVHTVTYYGLALYQEYLIKEHGIEDAAGRQVPVVLSFEEKEGRYDLKEYWQARNDNHYHSDIRNKFPASVADDIIDNSTRYFLPQVQNCYKQAVQFSGLDTDAVIHDLIDTICKDPEASSDPENILLKRPIESVELSYYGDYTLRYCLNRFLNGNETGLFGRTMALTCESLLQTKGRIPVDAANAETGQFWFDTLYAHASNKVTPYLE